jgi:hypothetical protein
MQESNRACRKPKGDKGAETRDATIVLADIPTGSADSTGRINITLT